MNIRLRLIGGQRSGQYVVLTTDQQRFTVTEPTPTRITSVYDPDSRTARSSGTPAGTKNVVYKRMPVKFGGATFTYSEDCLVLEGLSGNQINAEIRKLGIPEVRAYNFQYVYVDSAVIDRVGYDAEFRVMEVMLKSGEQYRYDDVTEYTYARFLSAPSRGRFYNTEIKGKFASYRVQK